MTDQKRMKISDIAKRAAEQIRRPMSMRLHDDDQIIQQAIDEATRLAKAEIEQREQAYQHAKLQYENTARELEKVEAEIERLRKAIDNSDYDISPCCQCGEPVVCIPEGLSAFCTECWAIEIRRIRETAEAAKESE